jgi:hypothetical protein
MIGDGFGLLVCFDRYEEGFYKNGSTKMKEIK